MGSKKKYFVGHMPAMKPLDEFFSLEGINISLRVNIFVSRDTETQTYNPFVGCYLTNSVAYFPHFTAVSAI